MTTTATELNARWYNWIALWFLLIALRSAIEVAAYHASGQAQATLLTLARFAGIGGAIVIWFACFYFLYLQTQLARTNGRDALLKGYLDLRPDDFVTQTLQRAGSTSFLAMLLALPVCEWLSQRLEGLPGEYIVDCLATVLLGSFSVAFLVQTHLATRAK